MPAQRLTGCPNLFLLLMDQTLQLQSHGIPLTLNKITAPSALGDLFNISIKRKNTEPF